MFDYLNTIKSNKELVQALRCHIDFELTDCGLDDLCAYSRISFSVFGCDGSGGLFGFIGEGNTNSLAIGYVSSEGQVGRIAANLTDFFHLIVFHPMRWQNLIGKDTKEMERYSNEMKFDDEVKEAQQIAVEAFNLKKENYSVSKFHSALMELPKFVVYTNDDRDEEWEDLLK